MTTTVWILILAAVLGAMLCIVLRQRRATAELSRQLQALQERQNTLEQKRPSLAKMAEHLEYDETHQLILHRYNLISELFAAAVANDTERSNAVLDEVERTVADHTKFKQEIRLVYARMQPVLMEHLQEHGLTDPEIEICCLYILGLNGKTIQKYTHDGRHFQKVGDIRKKLGLGEHDKNIDGFLRSLLR